MKACPNAKVVVCSLVGAILQRIEPPKMRAVAPQLLDLTRLTRLVRSAFELLPSLRPLRTRKQIDVGHCAQTASSFMSAETGTNGIYALT